MIKIEPNSLAAYRLFHEGALALARAEQQGIRIDLEYCETKKQELNDEIAKLENAFYQTKFYKHWEHSLGKVNINSNSQLATFLYKIKKIQPENETETGKGSTDEEALTRLNIPELNDLLKIRKLKKIRDTYLEGFIREQVNGVIHPSFNLHLVRTFRSCVAEGTKILVVRDFENSPNGVPIEDIKVGDFVYCFDDALRPSIQKVLWAGKTGNKKIIRVHWVTKGKKGYLDLTPEHKVRLSNGLYIPAIALLNDYRTQSENKHAPKCRVLSVSRNYDKLNFTGHIKNGKGIIESRLIYSELIGELNDSDIVHHSNKNHLDHSPSNLKKMSLNEHSRLHSFDVSDDIKLKRINTLNENRHKIVYKKGEQHINSINLTKYQCLKILAASKGQLTKSIYDFQTFKNYCSVNDIDISLIKLRFDKNGNYIWKKHFIGLTKLGISAVSSILGHNYYKLKKLYEFFGVPFVRKFKNQYGEFVVGNHVITKIEMLNTFVDVYDIEVEKYHNFIANEICVHNSSDRPNFQNIPKRDKEAMKLIRGALFPRKGNLLMEVDYSALEVRIAACYHQDPTMLKYIKDPNSDMHADMAKQIFKIKNFDKHIPEHKVLRNAAKNGFVFPEFYGDYYKNCANNIAIGWCKLHTGKFKSGEGIAMPDGKTISDHLIEVGINSYDRFVQHLQAIEEDFWGNRFPVYKKWKDEWFRNYCFSGQVNMFTGFTCSGLMFKNDVINYPVQGAAFHCLLWSFNKIDKILYDNSNNLQTRPIGQIHDAIILDVIPEELETIKEMVRDVMVRQLMEEYSWINVPLDVEFDIGEIDKSWDTL